MRMLMIGAFVLVSFAPDSARAQSARDSALLNDNPSGYSYQGRLVFPDYNKSSSGYKEYRSRINKAVSGGPNFAGKYAITVFGCGSGCAMGYMTDVSNGHVSALPFSGQEMPMIDLVYNTRSKTIIVYWQPDDICMRQTMVLDKDNFVLSRPENMGSYEVCEAPKK